MEYLPAGNQKTITKTVEISGNETTRVFVNMLNGDFTAKNSPYETLEKERITNEKHAMVTRCLYSIYKEYRF